MSKFSFHIVLKALLTVILVAFSSACSFSNSKEMVVLHDQPKRTFDVLLAVGNGASVGKAQQAFYKARRNILAQANIDLRLSEVVIKTHLSYDNSLRGFMKSWKEAATSQGTYDLVLLVLPEGTVAPKTREHTLGYSEGVGLVGKIPNAFAYTVLTKKSEVNTWALMHEVGHLLGASHASRGVMRDDRFPDDLSFSADSLTAIIGNSVKVARLVKTPQVAFQSFQ